MLFHNASGKDTYGESAARVRRIEAFDGKRTASFEGDTLPAAESDLIRRHGMRRVDAYLA